MNYRQYPKRNAISNYFPLPNEIFMLGLCAGEISVYSYLLCLENRKTFQCWPGYKTIGKAVDMSPNTVRKYVMALEEKKIIMTEPTSICTKDGRNSCLKISFMSTDLICRMPSRERYACPGLADHAIMWM